MRDSLACLQAKQPLLRQAAMKTEAFPLLRRHLWFWPGLSPEVCGCSDIRELYLSVYNFQTSTPFLLKRELYIPSLIKTSGYLLLFTFPNNNLYLGEWLEFWMLIFSRSYTPSEREKNNFSAPTRQSHGQQEWWLPSQQLLEEAREAGPALLWRTPSLPSTPQGREPQQLYSANTGQSQLWTKLKALAVSTRKRRENGAQVGKIIFPLVLLSSYDAKMSSFPSGLKILNILSLAQHSGCSHNHPYFNTKIKHCVP